MLPKRPPAANQLVTWRRRAAYIGHVPQSSPAGWVTNMCRPQKKKYACRKVAARVRSRRKSSRALIFSLSKYRMPGILTHELPFRPVHLTWKSVAILSRHNSPFADPPHRLSCNHRSLLSTTGECLTAKPCQNNARTVDCSATDNTI